MSNHPPKFQLRPKHLVTATLTICVTAIIALIIGVIGTFNPHDSERNQAEQAQQAQQDANRVEVWQPNGAVTPASVVTDPNPLLPQPADQQASADVPDTAGQPSRPEASPQAPRTEYHAHREAKHRPQRKPAEIQTANGNTVDATAQTPTESSATPATPRADNPAKPEKPATPPVERRAEPKPEPQHAAPAPKPQHKEVIDNLF